MREVQREDRSHQISRRREGEAEGEGGKVTGDKKDAGGELECQFDEMINDASDKTQSQQHDLHGSNPCKSRPVHSEQYRPTLSKRVNCSQPGSRAGFTFNPGRHVSKSCRVKRSAASYGGRLRV